MAQYELSTTQITLLEALKASLFKFEPNYPEDTDWEEVIKEAKAQTVMGIISPVIPVNEISTKQVIAKYIQILHEQDKMIKLLEDNGISCVILKGSAAAIYYPNPHLRAMGDVDFLVPSNQFKSAINVLESNGFSYTHGKDNNGNLISGERHIGYIKNGIEFELHHHFSSPGFDVDDILEQAILRREYREIDGYRIPMLPDIENGLVLLGHINHHLKDSNLGLRQIVDWEMYIHNVSNNIIWKESFPELLKKIGLDVLAISTTNMCINYLGLPNNEIWDKDYDTDISKEYLNALFSDGNFSVKSRKKSTKYGGRISRAVYRVRKKGVSYFQEIGLVKWKSCQRYPILKPFAWIYGLFRSIYLGAIAIIKTGGIGKQIDDGIERYDLYEKIGVKSKDN